MPASKYHLKIKKASSTLILFLFIFFLISSGRNAFTQEDNTFFSYKRFYLNRDVTEKFSSGGGAKNELLKFVKSYEDGLDAFSNGNFSEALEDFLKAREKWPEYYGTDFLIALTYERMGDYSKAARYYKTYLNKLRYLQEGEYRISGPLIISLTFGRIEPYERAREIIAEHLQIYGIDLNKVRPVYSLPFFLIPIIAGLGIAVLYIYVFYHLIPYLKRLRRRLHPPEGYWVCPKCASQNTNLSKECEGCGREREDG